MSKINGERKIAGFFRQLKILCWKNAKLTLRSKLGLIIELLISFLMVCLIGSLRFLVNTTLTQSTPSSTRSVIDLYVPQTTRELIFFYPNTSFIEAIVIDSMNLITRNNRSGIIGIN
jgi:hypothetical protein